MEIRKMTIMFCFLYLYEHLDLRIGTRDYSIAREHLQHGEYGNKFF